ncbi:MAG: hypothetical protein LBJ20_03225 [Candidatus Methanoplasma sp.]|nr:hypothetical protein [Candidatus Methanoplasma sp.]
MAGMLLIILPWMQVTLLGVEVGYDAFDMVFGDAFNGGLFDNFDHVGRLCPMLIGLMFLISTVSFARKSGTGAVAGGILTVLFAIYLIACINPESYLQLASRTAGISCWLAIIFSIAVILLGIVLRSKKKARIAEMRAQKEER